MMVRADELDTTRDVIIDARLRRTEWGIAAAHHCDVLTCLSGTPPDLPHGGRIAVYGDSQAIAQAVVDHLHKFGYARAALLDGGFEDWRDLGMPVQFVESF